MACSKPSKSIEEIREIILHCSIRTLRRLAARLHCDYRNEASKRSVIALHLLSGADRQTTDLLKLLLLARLFGNDWVGNYNPCNLALLEQLPMLFRIYGPLPAAAARSVEKQLLRQLAVLKRLKDITETRRQRIAFRNQRCLDCAEQIWEDALQQEREAFQRLLTIRPGMNPAHKKQVIDKILYCVKMIRSHGSRWIWQVEPYLNDPLYAKLLRYHADPHTWHNDPQLSGRVPGPDPRASFDVGAAPAAMIRWFRQGRRQDIHDYTVWGLSNLQCSPYFHETLGYCALLEEWSHANRGERLIQAGRDDLMMPPEPLPRRFSSFTRLTIARTVCSFINGSLDPAMVADPVLARCMVSARNCRDHGMDKEELATLLAGYLQAETERAERCYEAAFELVTAIWGEGDFDELCSRYGSDAMSRPTTHRAVVDTPARIADRMRYYYRITRKHGLLALESHPYPLRRKKGQQKPRYSYEPDPLIALLLRLLTDGKGCDLADIKTAFLPIFLRQCQDRAAIAAWGLYAWAVGGMQPQAVARVLLDCLEEGRPLKWRQFRPGRTREATDGT